MTDKKEIHTYQAEWSIYGMGISEKPDACFRFALGSFIEDYSNKIEIVQLDIDTGVFTKKAMVEHPYPTTKIMWIPDRQGIHSLIHSCFAVCNSLNQVLCRTCLRPQETI